MKNKEALFEELQSTAANYAYDNKDKNFEITVKISVKKGWAKVTEVEGEK